MDIPRLLLPSSVNNPRVRTTCRLWNSTSFPGINEKIQDPKVVNFTSIFFRTSYLQKKNKNKKGPQKYFFNPTTKINR